MKPSIKEIRTLIDRANWNRHDVTGGTREENARVDLNAVLLPWVAKLEALEIPARFARDIENRDFAIKAIRNVIARREGKLFEFSAA